MSPSEEASFLIELKQNPSLSQEVELFREILTAQDLFKKEGILDQLDQVWERSQEDVKEPADLPDKKPVKIFRIKPYTVLAAAISIGILLVCGLLLFKLQGPSPEAYQALKKWAQDEFPASTSSSLRSASKIVMNLSPDTVLLSAGRVSLECQLPEGFESISLSIKGESAKYHKEFELTSPSQTIGLELLPGAYIWKAEEKGLDMPPQLAEKGMFYVVDPQKLPGPLKSQFSK